jgi:hypothetical protein
VPSSSVVLGQRIFDLVYRQRAVDQVDDHFLPHNRVKQDDVRTVVGNFIHNRHIL